MFNWYAISVVVGVVGWIIAIVMLFIVPMNRKPSSATAWLLLIIIVPYFGIILYWLLSDPKLPKHRRLEQSKMNERISKILAGVKSQPSAASAFNINVPPRIEPFVTLNTNLSQLPAVGGNKVEVLAKYKSIFESLVSDIDRSRKFIHVEYFALSKDEETEGVFDALERAVRRGVKVRVLIDHLGSRKYPTFKATRSWLSSVGIENYLSLPVKHFGPEYTRIDLRNHRKIVVVDGQIGYTGSQNLIKRNYFRKDTIYYDELVARIRGPVVVELEAAFATDWFCETGELLTRDHDPEVAVSLKTAGNEVCQILPSGSGFENENNLKLFTSLIHAARHKIIITNPYFVPDDALMNALTTAAQRGVYVALINSEVSDQFLVSHAERSYYEELLKAGIHLFRYKAPILLHSKHITVDDDIAVIGSSNMDIRSFQLNLEITLICYSPLVVKALRKVEDAVLRKSHRVLLNEWQMRPVKEKIFENLARLTSALQ